MIIIKLGVVRRLVSVLIEYWSRYLLAGRERHQRSGKSIIYGTSSYNNKDRIRSHHEGTIIHSYNCRNVVSSFSISSGPDDRSWKLNANTIHTRW